MPTTPPRRARPSELSILETTVAHLQGLGYRTYLDPDGSSYFDLAVVRGDELGLVEGKVGNPKRVLLQALVRRAWADWVAVVVDSPRSAERLVRRTGSGRAATVGVWSVSDGRLTELRAPAHRVLPPAPFVSLKERLRAALDAIERGDTPAGVGWSGVVGEVYRASGGRGFSEWRLEELAD